MFPKSNTSQTIYDLFISESEKLGLGKSKIICNFDNTRGNKIAFQVNGHKLLFDKVIVCTGGSSKSEGFDWLKY